MTVASPKPAGRRLPILQGVLPIDRARIPAEVLAGTTLAALAIPEVMGYTSIAGMPVITGLYTILIPMALFAVFGSSRHLVVGADSATAAIMAAGLVGLAATGSTEYVAYAGVLAIMAGAFLLVARLLKLGFLADFLSRTVLIGFLTGVGIQVACGQVAGMLGVPGGGSGSLQKLFTALSQIGQANWYTVAVSVGVLGIILGSRKINKKIPGALIAVLLSIALGHYGNLAAQGVALLGPVPGGLPQIGLPQAGVTLSTLALLLPTAVSIFVVILAQSAATSRAYAARYNEKFSEDVDLVGLSVACVGAGLSGTFVVNGSPTKTQMVDSAGGHSQLAQITTSVVVLIVLLFLTGPLAFMPSAVLSSVVFLIGVELVDLAGMRRIYAQRKPEFWVAAITAATVVLVGVEQAIILAIVLSLLEHVRHGYKPHNTVVASDPAKGWHTSPLTRPEQAVPGLLIYRFAASMYYANSERLSEEVLELVTTANPPLAWLCIDAAAVPDVDFSAGATLLDLSGELKERGLRLVFSEVADNVRAELDGYGITAAVGEDAYFHSVDDVVKAFRQRGSAAGGTATDSRA